MENRRSFSIFFDVSKWILEWIDEGATVRSSHYASFGECIEAMRKSENIEWLFRITN